MHLAPHSDVIIIVDVLCFSTCVDIAIARGASVLPYFHKDERAKEYADAHGAKLASRRWTPHLNKKVLSLSPSSMQLLNVGDKVVLPSPNGSTISFSVEGCIVLCGCLRNAQAVAELAMMKGKRITVIAAGEKWVDGRIRFAIEDLLGAGAILSFLSVAMSPEAKIAVNAFRSVENNLYKTLAQCSSGYELIEKGFPEDVHISCQFDVSNTMPILVGKEFVGKFF